MHFKTIKRVFGFLLLTLTTTSASAQSALPEQVKPDPNGSALIARTKNDQRPSDVNAPVLANLFNSASASSTFHSTAELMNPAAHIYTDWDNKGVKSAHGYAPNRYKVDLRGFAMPTNNRKVTSPFGQRWGRLHAGIDIKVYIGDTIRAAFDGKIRIVDNDPRGYGKYVVIRHPNGLETLYGHMSRHLVKNNQIVRAGEPIGLGGNTGRSTGSHLHFETRICGVPVNPAKIFDFVHQDVTGDFYTTTQTYGRRE